MWFRPIHQTITQTALNKFIIASTFEYIGLRFKVSDGQP